MRPEHRRGRLLAFLPATWLAVAGLAACLSPCLAQGQEAPEPPKPVVILDGSGVWRVMHSFAAPLVQTAEGCKELRNTGRRADAKDRPDFHWMTQYPPAGWTAANFDDSSWCRRHFFAKWSNGESDERAGGGGATPYLRQLSLRGKFTVTDPAQVGGLWLDVRYRGGAVIFLNGQEIQRAHMPEGKIDPGSPAEMYDQKVYLKEDGKPWNWWGDRETIGKASYSLRPRALEAVPVPTRLLRKGTNVLAVEIHAAPFPDAFASARPEWSTCGLIELRLRAEKGDGIEANVVRPNGLQVWNSNVIADAYNADWADAHETLRPMFLAGARNGCYTGRVTVGSDQPIKELRAGISDLAGEGGATLPASAVRVSYGQFDPNWPVSRGGGGPLDYPGLDVLRDDAMVDEPPAEVPLGAARPRDDVAKARAADGLPGWRPGAVQSVYLTARIPEQAKPGLYRGTLTVSCQGHQPVKVPVELKVIDWALPDPADHAYWFGLIQSPEGVGRHYGVPLWSQRHWELIGRSFDRIAEVGSKVLFIPIGAETEYGNGESMVLWIKGEEGKYSHDFSRVEKYVDVALKHLGRPRFVVVGVWQFSEFQKHPRITAKDAAIGELANIDGPAHGSAESLELWRPVLTRVRQILTERGLERAMLLGYLSDRYPTKETVGAFHEILPEAGWQASRHPPNGGEYCAYEGGQMPVMYNSNVWGCGSVDDPDTGRAYGWNFKYGVPGGLRTWLDRGIYDHHPTLSFRGMSEGILLSNRPGQGQIGADFWPFKGEKGGPIWSLYNRFPHSANQGAGNKGCTTNQLLYPGPEGAVPTLRFEMVRENIQECEARIFLEKLLTAKPCPLPAELARKCQDILDERTRWHRVQGSCVEANLACPYSGWEERTAKLYEAAAEAVKALEQK